MSNTQFMILEEPMIIDYKIENPLSLKSPNIVL